MINLYQRGEVNRKMIQNHDLKKCKLALWFCILENGKYKRVSPISYSNITEECKILEMLFCGLLNLLFITGMKGIKRKKKTVSSKQKQLSKTTNLCTLNNACE